MSMSNSWIIPDWQAPATVKMLSTTRKGGVSSAPWDSFNLGDHVKDDEVHVRQNRQRLKHEAELPSEPLWMEQVHGNQVLKNDTARCLADARFSNVPGEVCVVMTADCLPVLFCDERGMEVAAAHAGWRGLAAGVLEQTLGCFDQPASAIMAWLGPAIGPQAFEVGDDVREVFVRQQPQAEAAFRATASGKWLADIYELARQRLSLNGVARVYGGDYCTYTDEARFFSYRRDGQTGRMASLIWLEK
jgi:YfiH family protein